MSIRLAGEAEGEAKGKVEGRIDYMIEVVCQNKAKGRTVSEMAEFLNEDVDRIAAIYDTCEAADMETKEE